MTQHSDQERVALRRTFDAAVEAAIAARTPVFIVGPDAKLIAHAARSLVERYGAHIDIAGSFAVSADFNGEEAEADRLLDRLRRSTAGVCIVGLSDCAAEQLSRRARAIGVSAVFVGVGMDRRLNRAPRFAVRTAAAYCRRVAASAFS